MADDPIEEKHREVMNKLAHVLADVFEGNGFMLLVFEFGDGGRINYISNADRESMIVAMKEFIAREEGRVIDGPKTKQ